jgi:hypothetical protein
VTVNVASSKKAVISGVAWVAIVIVHPSRLVDSSGAIVRGFIR